MNHFTKKTVYIGIMTFIILAILFDSIYLVINGSVLADEGQEYSDQIFINQDLDGDKKTEEVWVGKYLVDGKNQFDIRIKEDSTVLSKIRLTGFEDSVTFCKDNTLSLGDGKKAVCLQGFVGAHSANVELVQYRDQKLEPLLFNTGNGITPNMTSDAPNIMFDQLDGKFSAVSIDNRDYTKNPIVDIIRTRYYLSNDVLKLRDNSAIRLPSSTYPNDSAGQIK